MVDGRYDATGVSLLLCKEHVKSVMVAPKISVRKVAMWSVAVSQPAVRSKRGLNIDEVTQRDAVHAAREGPEQKNTHTAQN